MGPDRREPPRHRFAAPPSYEGGSHRVPQSGRGGAQNHGEGLGEAEGGPLLGRKPRRILLPAEGPVVLCLQARVPGVNGWRLTLPNLRSLPHRRLEGKSWCPCCDGQNLG